MVLEESWARQGLLDVRRLGASNDRVLFDVKTSAGESLMAIALDQASPGPARRQALRRQYEVMAAGGVAGLPLAMQWVDLPDLTGFLMRGVDGDCLDRLQRDGRLPLSEAYRIGVQIAATIVALHERKQLLLGVAPTQVFWNATTQQASMVDLGIASTLSDLSKVAVAEFMIGCDPLFLAPELGAGHGQPLDARADLYSFGAMLYWMMSGHRPQWVSVEGESTRDDCVLAPQAQRDLAARVPGQIAQVIVRLLQRRPQDRYPTAKQLHRELARAVQSLELDAYIEQFTLSVQREPSVLSPVNRLYGRELALKGLLARYDAVTRGQSDAVMISGHAGIGKSSLVFALRAEMIEERSLFIGGKVDQFQQSQPYSSLSAALVSENSRFIGCSYHQWTEASRAGGHDNVPFFQALLPGVGAERGLRDSPLPSDLTAAQMRKRFYLAVVALLQLLMSKQRSLVLFLDDLQWADLATLEIIEQLVLRKPLSGLLVVGAYRHNEVDHNHPLALMIGRLIAEGRAPKTIELAPLTQSEVEAWLAERLHASTAPVAELAEHVYERTGGNPFFVERYLQHVHQQGLLSFDRATRAWRWSNEVIRERLRVNDVVELMLEQLALLPEPSRHILAVSAIVGAEFSVSEAAALAGWSTSAAQQALAPALSGAFVRNRAGNTMVFNHDRIQEAAIRSLDMSSRRKYHWQMAHRLIQDLSVAQREARLFEIVDHLVAGREAHLEGAERHLFLEQVLDAARRARLSNAPLATLGYARAVIDALGETGWQDAPAQMFEAVREAQTAAYRCADMQAASAWFDELQQHMSDPVEMAQPWFNMLSQLVMSGRYEQSTRLAMQALAQLGVTISLDDPVADLAEQYAQHIQHVNAKGFEAVLGYRRRDARIEAAFQIIRAAIPGVFFWQPILAPLLGLRAVNLATESQVQFGLGYHYAIVGFAHIAMQSDYVACARSTQIGYEIAAGQGNDGDAAEVTHMQALIGSHWVAPLADGLPIADRAFAQLRDYGETQFAGYTFFNTLTIRTEAGYPLDDVEREVARAMRFVSLTRNLHAELSFVSCRQYVRALRGETKHPASFDDADFSEVSHRELIAANDMAASYFHIYKLMLAHYVDDWAGAWQRVPQAEASVGAILGFLLSASCCFHVALVRCRALRDGVADADGIERGKLDASLALLDLWATSAPQTFAHRAALVRAERFLLDGDSQQALKQFESAIEGARVAGFPHELGLALRLAGKAHDVLGMPRQARMLARASQESFARWGASTLVQSDQSPSDAGATDDWIDSQTATR